MESDILHHDTCTFNRRGMYLEMRPGTLYNSRQCNSLQESADNAGPDMGPPGKDALLEEACKKYEAATQLCPTLHEVHYLGLHLPC